MVVRKLDDLFDLLKDKEPVRIVAVCANDEHTISAVYQAVGRGIVKGILIGDQVRIASICAASGINVNDFMVVHEPVDVIAARVGVDMVNRGEADLLMKGLISSDKFVRSILNKENGLTNPGTIVSHVTLIESKNYHKLLIASDVAVIPLPDLKQKIVMIKYLTQVAKKLGIISPKIAVIAPSEQVIASIPSTIDAALLSKMNERGQITDCIVDGPLAMDVAIDRKSAEIKGLKSDVAGDADALLFPNLEAGNVFYKVAVRMAGSESATIAIGARVPIVLASRGDSACSKLYSIALGALMANED